MFLVPHTHWDRELYQPFQRFRLRLVDLVHGVLERAEADGRFCFTFDGQTAMLEDYLAIRPEAEPRIKALLAAGQLAVKPWRIRWIGASTGPACRTRAQSGLWSRWPESSPLRVVKATPWPWPWGSTLPNGWS